MWNNWTWTCNWLIIGWTIWYSCSPEMKEKFLKYGVTVLGLRSITHFNFYCWMLCFAERRYIHNSKHALISKDTCNTISWLSDSNRGFCQLYCSVWCGWDHRFGILIHKVVVSVSLKGVDQLCFHVWSLCFCYILWFQKISIPSPKEGFLVFTPSPLEIPFFCLTFLFKTFAFPTPHPPPPYGIILILSNWTGLKPWIGPIFQFRCWGSYCWDLMDSDLIS